MKNSVLLIVSILLLTLFQPSLAYADDHHWFKKVKDFFSSSFPQNPKYCVRYDGTIYIVGEIFKSKSCNKGDKEFFISTTPIASNGGAIGPQGPQGIQGMRGEDGKDGESGKDGLNGVNGTNGMDGVSGWEKIFKSTTTRGTEVFVSAICNGSKKVISGGYSATNSGSLANYYTTSNYPSSENTWTAGVHRANSAEVEWTLTVYAICANAI